MLLHTNLTVRDIGLKIGQRSLGTFTTRFTEKVGVTLHFRNHALRADNLFRSLQKLNDWPSSHPPSNPHAKIEGTIQAAVPSEGITLIGLFTKPIPKGLPLYVRLLSSLGDL